MLIWLLIPLIFAILWILTIIITLWFNSYIFPYFWTNIEMNLLTWFFISVLLILIYYIFFTKNLESDKFRDFLNKDITKLKKKNTKKK